MPPTQATTLPDLDPQAQQSVLDLEQDTITPPITLCR